MRRGFDEQKLAEGIETLRAENAGRKQNSLSPTRFASYLTGSVLPGWESLREGSAFNYFALV